MLNIAGGCHCFASQECTDLQQQAEVLQAQLAATKGSVLQFHMCITWIKDSLECSKHACTDLQ